MTTPKNDHQWASALGNAMRALEVFQKAVSEVDGIAEDMSEDKRVPISELAEFYFHASSLHEVADKTSKRLYHIKDRYNKGVIPQRMTDDGLDGLRVASIARSFSVVKKTSASFVDKEKGLEWLRGTGQGDMIQETVNAGTLSAYCRNLLLEEGIEPPEDVVRLNTYDTTSMVKYTPK